MTETLIATALPDEYVEYDTCSDEHETHRYGHQHTHDGYQYDDSGQAPDSLIPTYMGVDSGDCPMFGEGVTAGERIPEGSGRRFIAGI